MHVLLEVFGSVMTPSPFPGSVTKMEAPSPANPGSVGPPLRRPPQPEAALPSYRGIRLSANGLAAICQR